MESLAPDVVWGGLWRELELWAGKAGSALHRDLEKSNEENQSATLLQSLLLPWLTPMKLYPIVLEFYRILSSGIFSPGYNSLCFLSHKHSGSIYNE